VRFSGSGRTDEDDALGHIGRPALLHRLDDLPPGPLLELRHPPDRLEAVGGIEHLQQAGVLLLDQLRLVPAHQIAGQPALHLGLEKHVFEMDQAQAGGDVGELIRSDIGLDRPCGQAPGDEAQPGFPVRQGHFDRVIAGRAGAQGGMQVRQVLDEEEGERGGGLDLRVRPPAQEGHEERAFFRSHGAQVGRGQERLRVFDDDGHGCVGEHQAFQHRQRLAGLARPFLVLLRSAS